MGSKMVPIEMSTTHSNSTSIDIVHHLATTDIDHTEDDRHRMPEMMQTCYLNEFLLYYSINNGDDRQIAVNDAND